VGHPNASEKPLERILEGSFDLAAFRKEFVLEANAAAANAAISAMTRRCQESGGWDPLFQLYDQVAEQLPERAGIVGVDRFTTMIGLADQVDAGYAYGRSLMERHGDDGRVLRAIARVVLTNATVRRRDVDFAMKAAEAAGVIGQDKDPKALEVLGLAWFAKGDRERAVAFVERAKSLETERKFLKQYDRTLARFRREKPGPMPPFVPRTGAATTVAPAPTAEGG
jgi:hypothetical protein